MSLGCTDISASHIEQRRWLAVAGPKTAELEINLKNANKLCSVPQAMSSAMCQDALRLVEVCALPKMHTADASCLRTAMGWVRMCAAWVASQAA